MFDFYTRFYRAVATSAANAEYCERVYGRNLCQHGFADLRPPRPSDRGQWDRSGYSRGSTWAAATA